MNRHGVGTVSGEQEFLQGFLDVDVMIDLRVMRQENQEELAVRSEITCSFSRLHHLS